MLTVLVIGGGTMGKFHIRSYHQMANVRVVGVVDARKETVNGLTIEGTKTFGSFEEAISELTRVDIVDICLPTYMHKEYVQQATDVCQSIICEKPLARTMEEANGMIESCKTKGVNLYVGHVLRFFPEYRQAKRAVESGEIGQIGVVRTSRNDVFPQAWNDWYADYQKSGGLVLDLIIHDFDFLRWCFGDVERVYAKGLLGRVSSKKDYALVTLRFKNGVMAHVEGSWAHGDFSTTFEIAGSKGIIDYNSSDEKSLHAFFEKTQESVSESPLKNSPYFLELLHFVQCIETENKPIVTAEDAQKAMELSLAALESIETGKVVRLNN